MNKILIVEDDKDLAFGLCRALASEQITTISSDSISSARTKLNNENFSLIILDVNLPDGNGFDFLEEIKKSYNISVVMLTANDLEFNIVTCLENGADDYILKPFSLAVLRARINAQLRKRTNQNINQLILDKYIFNFDSMKFTVDNVITELSKTEQKLLKILTDNAGTTISRDTLIDWIWTDGSEYVDENALSVTIKRLRDKLDAKKYIKTVYGIGYMWVKHND